MESKYKVGDLVEIYQIDKNDNELYATYEDYQSIVKISEILNNENENLQNQLQDYKDKEDKIIKYIINSDEYIPYSYLLEADVLLEMLKGDE